MSEFRKNKNVNKVARAQIAEHVGLSELRVQVLFSWALLTLC